MGNKEAIHDHDWRSGGAGRGGRAARGGGPAGDATGGPGSAGTRDGTAFGVTAAVLNHLDLVITCDTAVAHLAGALGRPTWLLLAHRSDWRWMRDREDSPWYPGDVVEALAAVAD